jgi:hypothetical protein
MTRHALLGLAVVVFCVAGLALGIARVAPGSSALDIGLAAVAAAVGCALFAISVRVGRRGSHPQTKWLIVPILVLALFIDRLSERWQLALLVFGAGYVAAFLATVVVRAARLTR